MNEILVEESKNQGLELGDTGYNFSFPEKDTLAIFGMEIQIDNNLDLSGHISNVCKKINNLLNVLMRVRNLIHRDTLLKIYKAFNLPFVLLLLLCLVFL